MIEVVVVFMVLLALKLVQRYRVVFIILVVEVMTCGVCTPPPCFIGGGGGFFKRGGGGLTESQFLEGVYWERGSDLFQEKLQFLHKKN